ncbi:MAG: NapC/NirT family cytochrome c [Gammaproteobacteria bacterium]|nr:NapC/NirT family cytochrome c [Gammaproteobacteria bacterium]
MTAFSNLYQNALLKVRELYTRRPYYLFFISFIIGILTWGGFNMALEQTNTMDFCISCHEMKDNVYQEYKKTIHYANRTGVKAKCPDCHVPKEWHLMFIKKIMASRELFSKITGSIDTTEKFQKKRLDLAKYVWSSLQQSDSRECRNCHNYKSMNFSLQQSRSENVHQLAQERGKTCIDCHKGIAHHLPEGVITQKGGSDDDHSYYEKKKIACYLCHPDMPKPIEEDWGF